MRITPARAGQREIARLAGLTQPAVSQILNGKAHSIPEATCERVRNIARELGYRVDPIARRLATGRNQILGVFTYERIFSPAQRSLYHPYLLGVEEAAEEAGHDLLLLTSAAIGETRSIYAKGENKLRLVDGAVLLGRNEVATELEELTMLDYPFVFVGRRFLLNGDEVPNVAPDYASATCDLATLLAAHGHRRIAYLGANRQLPATNDRLVSIDASGLEASRYFLPLAELGHLSARDMIASGVTAVVAENDLYAERLCTLLEQDGKSVPRDLSVCVAGVSEDDSGERWSGYRIPAREVGKLAVQEVLRRLDGSTPRRQLVSCPRQPGNTISPPGA